MARPGAQPIRSSRLCDWRRARSFQTPASGVEASPSDNRALPFYWIDQAVPLLEEKAMRAFLKHAAPLKPVLIVFDTLSRCFIGGDENSASDMGMAMAACDDLRARTKALVALLHHTKKDGTVERGSSALRGAVDTILTLEEDDEQGLLTLTCERQKDAEAFEPFQIQRRVVQLDGVYDEEGNHESSCVIQLATDTGIQRRATRHTHSRSCANAPRYQQDASRQEDRRAKDEGL